MTPMLFLVPTFKWCERPVKEFDTTIYNPCYKNDIDLLESV